MLDNSVELRTRWNSRSMLHQLHQGRCVPWMGWWVSPLRNIQTTQPHFYLETSKDQLSPVVLDPPGGDGLPHPPRGWCWLLPRVPGEAGADNAAWMHHWEANMPNVSVFDWHSPGNTVNCSDEGSSQQCLCFNLPPVPSSIPSVSKHLKIVPLRL